MWYQWCLSEVTFIFEQSAFSQLQPHFSMNKREKIKTLMNPVESQVDSWVCLPLFCCFVLCFSPGKADLDLTSGITPSPTAVPPLWLVQESVSRSTAWWFFISLTFTLPTTLWHVMYNGAVEYKLQSQFSCLAVPHIQNVSLCKRAKPLCWLRAQINREQIEHGRLVVWCIAAIFSVICSSPPQDYG